MTENSDDVFSRIYRQQNEISELYGVSRLYGFEQNSSVSSGVGSGSSGSSNSSLSVGDILFDDDLYMNNHSIKEVKHIDFDDPSSSISGVASIGWYQLNHNIFSSTVGLTYLVDVTQKHSFQSVSGFFTEFREVNSNDLRVDIKSNTLDNVGKTFLVSPSTGSTIPTSGRANMLWNEVIDTWIFHTKGYYSWESDFGDMMYLGWNLGYSELSKINIIDLEGFARDESMPLTIDNGEIWQKGNDVKVKTGGTILNLSDLAPNFFNGDMSGNTLYDVNAIIFDDLNRSILQATNGLVVNAGAGDEIFFMLSGFTKMTIQSNEIDFWEEINMNNKAIKGFTGVTAGIGQAFYFDSFGATWEINYTEKYNFKVGGYSKVEIASGGIDINDALDMNQNKITGISEPTNPTDVASKQYVDNSSWSGFATSDLDMNFQDISKVGDLQISGTLDLGMDVSLTAIGAGAILPDHPVAFIKVKINGGIVKIPYYF
ncbi:MAG: hypothetical protein MAG458_00685 [Nitrosopumilus sp.]|nr:hypothetical protein [Nitrosopumilus sp.]